MFPEPGVAGFLVNKAVLGLLNTVVDRTKLGFGPEVPTLVSGQGTKGGRGSKVVVTFSGKLYENRY